MTDEELLGALRERALLEGDFVLRSGRHSPYYLDKYRFSTQPDLLAALGGRLAALVRQCDPEAVRLAAPELGAVPLAAAAALASGLPFVIVRGAAKEHGTQNRIEGPFDPGERICLVEDVVTSGGAAVEAIGALREAGLECRSALCVVDREEGGVDALARRAVRLWPLFTAHDVVGSRKSAANPHG